MKLKEFNKDNSASLKKSDVAVSFNRKSGVICFTKGSVEFFDLKEGDEIIVAQDEETKKDWYFAKKKGGFVLRSDSANQRLKFNNTRTVLAILGSLDSELVLFKCYIGTEPIMVGKIDYYPIITLSIK